MFTYTEGLGARIAEEECVPEAGKERNQLKVEVAEHTDSVVFLNEMDAVFSTNQVMAGLGRQCMRGSDLIAVLDKGSMAYVLQPAMDGRDQHFLIGECYIYEITNEEA